MVIVPTYRVCRYLLFISSLYTILASTNHGSSCPKKMPSLPVVLYSHYTSDGRVEFPHVGWFI